MLRLLSSSLRLWRLHRWLRQRLSTGQGGSCSGGARLREPAHGRRSGLLPGAACGLLGGLLFCELGDGLLVQAAACVAAAICGLWHSGGSRRDAGGSGVAHGRVAIAAAAVAAAAVAPRGVAPAAVATAAAVAPRRVAAAAVVGDRQGRAVAAAVAKVGGGGVAVTPAAAVVAAAAVLLIAASGRVAIAVVPMGVGVAVEQARGQRGRRRQVQL